MDTCAYIEPAAKEEPRGAEIPNARLPLAEDNKTPDATIFTMQWSSRTALQRRFVVVLLAAQSSDKRAPWHLLLDWGADPLSSRRHFGRHGRWTRPRPAANRPWVECVTVLAVGENRTLDAQLKSLVGTRLPGS